MHKEMLVTIPNFPNYAITKDGRVYNTKFNRFLKPQTFNGYKSVCLYKSNRGQYKRIHRLVLDAFVGSCPKGFCACHNNGNKADNKLSNLRWDSHSNNYLDKLKHGTDSRGEKCYNAKLTEQDVRCICLMYAVWDYTQQELAEMYSTARSNISFIINKKSWKHIW